MTLPIAAPSINLTLLIERYCPYVTGTWWTGKGYPNGIPTLTWTANDAYAQELAIRSAAMNAFTLAVADQAGISGAYRARCAQLIAAVARQHISNPAVGTQAWGSSWQSPLWAAWAGLAAYLAWDQIPNATERDNVRRMLIAEASYVVAQRPALFWKDASGVELRIGDSAAEENSWCATVLWVALALMPTHPDALTWTYFATELNVTSFCAPADLGNPDVADYIRGRGSNVRPDYLVVNHGRIHPDYSTTVTQNTFGPVCSALAGTWCPSEVWWNFTKVRYALQAAPMDTAGTIAYDRTTPTVHFPVGTPNDWGVRRPAGYVALDLLGKYAPAGSTPAALDLNFWAAIRSADLSSMQARPASASHPAGAFPQTGLTPAEATYPEENAYAASQVAYALLAQSALG